MNTSLSTRTRILTGALAGVALAVAVPLAASAHVHVTPDSSAAETTTNLTFSFSHGCGESPTTALVVDIPDGVTNVVPALQAGWSIDRVLADDGSVRQVTYTADAPIENGLKAEASMDVRFSADLAETEVAIPVTQNCVTGSTAWTEITAEGEDEPESPAPVVAVGAVAEDDGHGHGAADSDHEHDAAAAEETAAVTPAADPLGVWLGAGGLALGAAALVVAIAAYRRRRA
jgi:uncharacterized protein YcnI